MGVLYITPYMLLRCIHTVVLVLSLCISSSAQNKWDLDSVYLAEFGVKSDRLIDTNIIEIPEFLSKSAPLSPFFGIIDATTEIKLEPNNYDVIGFSSL